MADSKQKKKIMCGMRVPDARRKFLQIWQEANPGIGFNKIKKQFTQEVGGRSNIWVWLETWFRLRSRNETFEAVAQAFAEKISNMHKQQQEREKTIHHQREELKKRLQEIDALKAQLEGAVDHSYSEIKPHASE